MTDTACVINGVRNCAGDRADTGFIEALHAVSRPIRYQRGRSDSETVNRQSGAETPFAFGQLRAAGAAGAVGCIVPFNENNQTLSPRGPPANELPPEYATMYSSP